MRNCEQTRADNRLTYHTLPNIFSLHSFPLNYTPHRNIQRQGSIIFFVVDILIFKILKNRHFILLPVSHTAYILLLNQAHETIRRPLRSTGFFCPKPKILVGFKFGAGSHEILVSCTFFQTALASCPLSGKTPKTERPLFFQSGRKQPPMQASGCFLF